MYLFINWFEIDGQRYCKLKNQQNNWCQLLTGEGLQGFISPTAQQILVNKLTHAPLAAGFLHDDDARNFLNGAHRIGRTGANTNGTQQLLAVDVIADVSHVAQRDAHLVTNFLSRLKFPSMSLALNEKIDLQFFSPVLYQLGVFRGDDAHLDTLRLQEL